MDVGIKCVVIRMMEVAEMFVLFAMNVREAREFLTQK